MSESIPRQAEAVGSIEEDEISLLDLLQVIVNNLRLLIFGPLLVGVVALGVSFALTPIFTANTKFLPPQQQQSSASAMLANLGALGGLAGAAGVIKNPADQYVAFLKTRTIQEALNQRFDLAKRYDVKFKDDVYNTLASNINITSGKDGLITIESSDKDPQFAAQLANAHIEELGKLLNRLTLTEAQQRRAFFEKQLNNAKTNLVKAEQALKASGVNASALKANPAAAIEGLAKLKANITAQEIKLASMRSYLTDSAPEFRQAQAELSAMRSQVARAEKEDTLSNGGLAGSDNESDYVTKYREFKYYETLFELFAKQYEIARVDESREGATIQIIDPAVTPERKSKPKKGLIALLAAVASFIILLGFVFVRRSLRNGTQDPEMAEKWAQIRTAWWRTWGQRS